MRVCRRHLVPYVLFKFLFSIAEVSAMHLEYASTTTPLGSMVPQSFHITRGYANASCCGDIRYLHIAFEFRNFNAHLSR
jgi:fucose 4-O-acetylase-like acetyltransferase